MKAAEAGLEHEDQYVDLPDLGHEGQAQRHARAHQIERHEERARDHPVRESPGDGGDADVGDHLDREDRAEHHRGPVACEVEREQAECDRREPGAEQRHDLRGEQVAVGPVGENPSMVHSEIACDRLQLRAIRPRALDVEAVVHVVMDQHALGVGHGLLDRLQLLRDLGQDLPASIISMTGAEMPVGAFQSGNQRRVGCMRVWRLT